MRQTKKALEKEHCWHEVTQPDDKGMIRVYACCWCGYVGVQMGHRESPAGHGLFCSVIDWGPILVRRDAPFYCAVRT